MTLVVSDASPLNYLVILESEGVLPILFGTIVVPTQVIEELNRAKAPEPVRIGANEPPNWVLLREGDASRFPSLNYGEAAAMSLALDSNARLLVDEIDARTVATSLGIPVIGTVGILAEAHLISLLDFDVKIVALLATNYRVHRNVIAAARERIVARQSGFK